MRGAAAGHERGLTRVEQRPSRPVSTTIEPGTSSLATYDVGLRSPGAARTATAADGSLRQRPRRAQRRAAAAAARRVQPPVGGGGEQLRRLGRRGELRQQQRRAAPPSASASPHVRRDPGSTRRATAVCLSNGYEKCGRTAA